MRTEAAPAATTAAVRPVEATAAAMRGVPSGDSKVSSGTTGQQQMQGSSQHRQIHPRRHPHPPQASGGSARGITATPAPSAATSRQMSSTDIGRSPRDANSTNSAAGSDAKSSGDGGGNWNDATSPSASASGGTAPNDDPNVEQTISYSAERIVGHGSFGVVFQAVVVETRQVVAIKKVLQDKRFKNRELQIMRLLSRDPHVNIVALKHCFYSRGEKPEELYLNLVLEYVPETVYSISRHHQKSKVTLPLLYVKLYMYQLCRALAHIHGMGICHRDIKPQNLLVDPRSQQLKLCDFGSAKNLQPGEPNVSYICSRYYRAPELIFGSTDYTTAIDVWSQGCVGAELLIGQPLFPGDSGVDQLVEIIKVLGTPTREQISAMNSNYTEFKFPQIKACQWKKIFRSKTPEEAMDFVGKMLAYAPAERMNPLDGCAHAFFDELREESTRLPGGAELPPLFDFTAREMEHFRVKGGNDGGALLSKIIPEYARKKAQEQQQQLQAQTYENWQQSEGSTQQPNDNAKGVVASAAGDQQNAKGDSVVSKSDATETVHER